MIFFMNDRMTHLFKRDPSRACNLPYVYRAEDTGTLIAPPQYSESVCSYGSYSGKKKLEIKKNTLLSSSFKGALPYIYSVWYSKLFSEVL